ncbi:MAG: dac [Acidimicrobiales bacterium]|nr:dac [Acidimicrobiales bacterium]
MRRTVLPVLLVVTALALGVLGFRSGTSDAAASGRTTGGTATPVLSARRVPVWLAAPVADQKLRDRLDHVATISPAATCLVVSAAGRVIYEHNADQAVTPASDQKLVTASVALDLLGSSFRYRTPVVGAHPGADGTVAGDAWLVGGGDPTLATKAYADHYTIHSKIHTPLETLADNLVKAGVKRITGRLLGDDSRYDAQRYVASWPDVYRTQNESGPISALTVNHGFVSWPSREGPSARDNVAATDPPANAAQVLGDLLKQRGVTVGGTGTGRAPAGAAPIAAVDSPPMPQILEALLTGSDNQIAESLVKEIGLRKAGAGTTAAGMKVFSETVARLGLGRPGQVAVDGSGLDESNKVTCRMISGLLDRAGRGGPLGRALAVSGETGTLATRFLDPSVKGRLRAKTGTLNTVSALSGYADAQQGASLTFAYIATGRTVNPGLLRIQDDLGAALVSYPEGPLVAQLGPR